MADWLDRRVQNTRDLAGEVSDYIANTNSCHLELTFLDPCHHQAPLNEQTTLSATWRARRERLFVAPTGRDANSAQPRLAGLDLGRRLARWP